MSDCDDYDDYDLDDDEFESEVDYSSDDDGEYDPNREYPHEVETNFICVDASSLVPERLIKCGHNKNGVFCFLVRWKGYEEELDDWVPSSDLPIRLIDEFYCSRINMETPVYDDDCDSEFDEDDGDYSPYVPLTQRQIKRQLREAGCYGKVRKPVTSLSKIVLQSLVGPIYSPQDPVTMESVRARVAYHQDRLQRLTMLNERLQKYLNTRLGKPPPHLTLHFKLSRRQLHFLSPVLLTRITWHFLPPTICVFRQARPQCGNFQKHWSLCLWSGSSTQTLDPLQHVLGMGFCSVIPVWGD